MKRLLVLLALLVGAWPLSAVAQPVPVTWRPPTTCTTGQALVWNGSIWTCGAGGITNAAGANVIPKSDGTNLVASSATDYGTTWAISTTLTLNTSGTPELFSTRNAASTDGDNIWIGGGGASAAYDGVHSYSGSTNTSLGHNALLANTIGNGNTAVGVSALTSNTTGVFNTAFGIDALLTNTIGVVNTAVGDGALQNNLDGNYNVGIGANALFSNTSGVNNVSVGHDSLSGSLTANYTVSVGDTAMLYHTSGDYQTAVGAYAMRSDLTGTYDTAIGATAMFNNTSGAYNTAVGYNALVNNATGSSITAVGAYVLPNYAGTGTTNNTAIGYLTGGGLTTGTGNTIIGANVTGLAAGLSNQVIIADGDGNQRITADSAGLVTIPGALTVDGSATLNASSGTTGIGAAASSAYKLLVANANGLSATTHRLVVDTTGGATNALSQIVGVKGTHASTFGADVADLFYSGYTRKNLSKYSHVVGDDVASDGHWRHANSTATLAYTTTTDGASPYGYDYTDTVGQITCTGATCTSTGAWYQYQATSATTGIADLRNMTMTVSVWVKTASGTNSNFTIQLSRYGGNDLGNTTCTANSSTWTRCSYTRTFNNTSYTDNSELDAYLIPQSTTAHKIAGVQIELGADPTPLEETDGTSGSGAYAYQPSIPGGYSIGTAYDYASGAWTTSLGIGGTGPQNPYVQIGPYGDVYAGTVYATTINNFTQVVQAADQDVTNAGLTDSNTLLFATSANKIYRIIADLTVGGSDTTGDIVIDFAVSAGTMNCSGTESSLTTADAIQNTAVIATAAADTNDTSIGTRADATLPIAVHFELACKVSNATNLKLRFGNNSAAVGRVSRMMYGSRLQYQLLN